MEPIGKVTGVLEVEKRGRKKRFTGKLTGFIFQDGSVWVAYCRELDLSSCGDSPKKAGAALKEAASLFFETCIASGTLDKALTSLGWICLQDGQALSCDNIRVPKKTTPAFMIDQMKTRGIEWSSRVSFG